jgi:hypothetical protein
MKEKQTKKDNGISKVNKDNDKNSWIKQTDQLINI